MKKKMIMKKIILIIQVNLQVQNINLKKYLLN